MERKPAHWPLPAEIANSPARKSAHTFEGKGTRGTGLRQVTSSERATRKTNTSGHPVRCSKANRMPCVDLVKRSTSQNDPAEVRGGRQQAAPRQNAHGGAA